MKAFPHILLASKSPRRHEIFRGSGFSFDIVEIDVDESFPAGLNGAEVCMYLAEKKANHYTQKLEDNILVTADTIVWLHGEAINKPADKNDAVEMLTKLSGNMHEVFTGVCIRGKSEERVFYQRTEVYFRKLTESEILHYIDTYQPYDKAGSYGVQDWMGYIGVEKINGCFYNVMGFPMSKFYTELTQFA